MLYLFAKQTTILNIDVNKIRIFLMNAKQEDENIQCTIPLTRYETRNWKQEFVEYYIEEWMIGNVKIAFVRYPGLKVFMQIITPNNLISECEDIIISLWYSVGDLFELDIQTIYKLQLWVDISKLERITFNCPPVVK